MEPTLKSGSTVKIVSSEFQEGDIVIAQNQQGEYIVKRYTSEGLKGDSERISETYSLDQVKILGKVEPLDLKYTEDFQAETALAAVTVNTPFENLPVGAFVASTKTGLPAYSIKATADSIIGMVDEQALLNVGTAGNSLGFSATRTWNGIFYAFWGIRPSQITSVTPRIDYLTNYYSQVEGLTLPNRIDFINSIKRADIPQANLIPKDTEVLVRGLNGDNVIMVSYWDTNIVWGSSSDFVPWVQCKVVSGLYVTGGAGTYDSPYILARDSQPDALSLYTKTGPHTVGYYSGAVNSNIPGWTRLIRAGDDVWYRLDNGTYTFMKVIRYTPPNTVGDLVIK